MKEVTNQPNWEVITFVYNPTDGKWKVFSTAQVPWEPNFCETLQAVAKEVQNENVCLCFDPAKGQTISRVPGKKRALERHFEFVKRSVAKMNNDLIKEKRYIITFVFDPDRGKWAVVSTAKISQQKYPFETLVNVAKKMQNEYECLCPTGTWLTVYRDLDQMSALEKHFRLVHADFLREDSEEE